MGKNIFHGLLIAVPLAALVVFLAFMGKEEVKQEQRVQQATQKIEDAKFDDEFNDAWNGKSLKKRAANMDELKADLAKAKAKRDGLDLEADDLHGAMNQAIADEDARLSGKPASSVKSATLTINTKP